MKSFSWKTLYLWNKRLYKIYIIRIFCGNIHRTLCRNIYRIFQNNMHRLWYFCKSGQHMISQKNIIWIFYGYLGSFKARSSVGTLQFPGLQGIWLKPTRLQRPDSLVRKWGFSPIYLYGSLNINGAMNPASALFNEVCSKEHCLTVLWCPPPNRPQCSVKRIVKRYEARRSRFDRSNIDQDAILVI